MIQGSPLGGFLMAGILGAGTTALHLWVANVAWWGVLLGYGLGGMLTMMGCALLWTWRNADCRATSSARKPTRELAA